MKSKNSILYSFLVLMLFASLPTLQAQKQIKWTTLGNLSSKKMTVVFIYKNDEPWSNRMNALTLGDPAIIKYGNKKFNFVKLEATENASEISSLGITLQGYPTTVILDKEEQVLQDIPGYIEAKDFESIINYYGEETYKEKTWDDYRKEYKVDEGKYTSPKQ